MNFFDAAEVRQKDFIEYVSTFRLFNLGGDRNRPNPFNVIPQNKLEGYAWHTKMLCRMAADTNEEYNRFYYNTDYAEVYELYVLKQAASL